MTYLSLDCKPIVVIGILLLLILPQKIHAQDQKDQEETKVELKNNEEEKPLDAQKGRDEKERKLANYKRAKAALDKEYNRRLETADQEFELGNLEKAKMYYHAATDLMPNEKYPYHQMAIIDLLLEEALLDPTDSVEVEVETERKQKKK